MTVPDLLDRLLLGDNVATPLQETQSQSKNEGIVVSALQSREH